MNSNPPEAPGTVAWLAAYAISMIFAIVFGEWTAPVVVIATRLATATIVVAMGDATRFLARVASAVDEMQP